MMMAGRSETSRNAWSNKPLGLSKCDRTRAGTQFTQKELGQWRTTPRAPGNTSTLRNRLKRVGDLVRQPLPKERRTKRESVRLTSKGKKALASAMPFRKFRIVSRRG